MLQSIKQLSRNAGTLPALAVGAVSLLLLASCGSSGPPSSSGTANKASSSADSSCDASAAAKDGTVVFYNQLEAGALSAVTKGFESKYPGVKLVGQVSRGSETEQKVITEHASGQVIGDVVAVGTQSLQDMAQKGLLQKFQAPGTADLYSGLKDKEGYANPAEVNVYGLTINTTLISGDTAPKDWSDLTKPAYKGLMLAQDPRGSGGGLYVFADVQDAYGKGFIEDLAKQKITFGSSSSTLATSLARGEGGMLITQSYAQIKDLIDGGAPLKFIAPSSGLIIIPISAALVSNAPHPAAAKCFIDWLLSTDGQNVIAQTTYTPSRSDVSAVNGFKLEGLKVFGKFDGTDVNEIATLSKYWESAFSLGG